MRRNSSMDLYLVQHGAATSEAGAVRWALPPDLIAPAAD
jgi:hypothetical protein